MTPFLRFAYDYSSKSAFRMVILANELKYGSFIAEGAK